MNASGFCRITHSLLIRLEVEIIGDKWGDLYTVRAA